MQAIQSLLHPALTPFDPFNYGGGGYSFNLRRPVLREGKKNIAFITSRFFSLYFFFSYYMSNASVPQLPNPFTPLAFFPPEAARQTTVFYYVSVGALAVSFIAIAQWNLNS